jgi:hypothetical protein
MESLEKQSPAKKVKADSLVQQAPRENTQSVGMKLDELLLQPTHFMPEGTLPMEVKQESIESEIIKPFPIKVQPKQVESFAANTSVPQLWGMSMPGLNTNASLMGQLNLALGYEQARRELINQLVMRKIQMNVQQNFSSMFGQNIEVKTENL